MLSLSAVTAWSQGKGIDKTSERVREQALRFDRVMTELANSVSALVHALQRGINLSQEAGNFAVFMKAVNGNFQFVPALK